MDEVLDFVRRVFEPEEARFIAWLRRHKRAFSLSMMMAAIIVAIVLLYFKFPELFHTAADRILSRSTPLWVSLLFVLWLLALTWGIYQHHRSTAVIPTSPETRKLAGQAMPTTLEVIIRGLTASSLAFLEAALKAYRPSSRKPLVLRVPDAKRGERACEELQLQEIISLWRVKETESGATITFELHPRLASVSKAKMLEVVQDELLARRIARLPP